ncbi:MAG: prepilin-type N-terminal cleavage/methylation domain-containing protein [Bacillota bacterium]|nr:prepilin-type N-terminal cleavage/methylation domain-containing protein [Bacillota bacterium]
MDRKGFSLIEIIIVIAILGIISLLLSGIVSYTLKSYDTGIHQQNEQFNVRLVADQLSEYAKSVSHIGLYDNLAAAEAAAGGYVTTKIFYLNGNEILIKFSNSGTEHVLSTDEFISNLKFGVEQNGDIYYLLFEITSDENYAVAGKFELLNIDDDSEMLAGVVTEKPVLLMIYDYEE